MSMMNITQRYQKRIMNDIKDVYTDPVEGIFIVPDDDMTTTLHALIIGPKDTPYDGGFFYFIFKYPESYPLKPPAVQLITTGNGTVRFNPNLYNNGKVCLSILGTWSGPSWTSIMTTKSVLISIQSLMSENPYFNEPGFEKMQGTKQGKDASAAYNDRIVFEKIRVAVIEMVENSLPPEALAEYVLLAESSTSSLPSASSESGIPPAKMQKPNQKASQLAKKIAKHPPYVTNLSAMPQVLKEIILKEFCKRKDFYISICDKNKGKGKSPWNLGGHLFDVLQVGHRDNSHISYDSLAAKINALRSKINLEDNLADHLMDSLVSRYRKGNTNPENTNDNRGREDLEELDFFDSGDFEQDDDDEVVLGDSDDDQVVEAINASLASAPVAVGGSDSDDDCVIVEDSSKK